MVRILCKLVSKAVVRLEATAVYVELELPLEVRAVGGFV